MRHSEASFGAQVTGLVCRPPAIGANVQRLPIIMCGLVYLYILIGERAVGCVDVLFVWVLFGRHYQFQYMSECSSNLWKRCREVREFAPSC